MLNRKNKCIEESSGWEDDSHFDRYNEKYKNLNYKLINLANDKVTLFSILKHYQIIDDLDNDFEGWSSSISCPFADHHDSTPSFGFNYREDRFYCFGCKKSGRAVQFIAFMESLSQVEVAKKLIPVHLREEGLEQKKESDIYRIRDLLFNYADFVRDFIVRCNDDQATQYVENVNWNLSVYISSMSSFSLINYKDLEARINKLKEFLNVYEV